MKTQLSIFAIVVMAFAVMAASPIPSESVVNTGTILKKPSSCFSFFRTHRQGKGATASWGVNSNAGINGFVLQRTYEDPNDPYSVWEDVTTTQCNASRSYKHTDTSVYPGFITYRVVAVMADGSTSVSELSTVHIVSHG